MLVKADKIPVVSPEGLFVDVTAGCWNGAAAYAESTCRCLQGYQADARLQPTSSHDNAAA